MAPISSPRDAVALCLYGDRCCLCIGYTLYMKYIQNRFKVLRIYNNLPYLLILHSVLKRQLFHLLTCLYCWPVCIVDLFVLLTCLYCWPVCIVDLFVLLTCLCCWPVCIVNLFVLLTCLYCWPVCIVDLFVLLTCLYCRPVCIYILWLSKALALILVMIKLLVLYCVLVLLCTVFYLLKCFVFDAMHFLIRQCVGVRCVF